VVGTRCPFCPFVLPAGQLLNGLIEYIAVAHPGVRLRGLTLADHPVLRTDPGELSLRSADRFD
jgi:hypothetical protein